MRSSSHNPCLSAKGHGAMTGEICQLTAFQRHVSTPGSLKATGTAEDNRCRRAMPAQLRAAPRSRANTAVHIAAPLVAQSIAARGCILQHAALPCLAPHHMPVYGKICPTDACTALLAGGWRLFELARALWRHAWSLCSVAADQRAARWRGSAPPNALPAC